MEHAEGLADSSTAPADLARAVIGALVEGVDDLYPGNAAEA
jgi:hypothetical protein